MTDLAEFLLARIAEDATAAANALDQPTGYRWRTLSWLTEANREHGLRHDPARVLAECEVKRQLVNQLSKCEWIEAQGHVTGYAQGELGAYRVAVRLLAMPYADHPDYREEWRV